MSSLPPNDNASPVINAILASLSDERKQQMAEYFMRQTIAALQQASMETDDDPQDALPLNGWDADQNQGNLQVHRRGNQVQYDPAQNRENQGYCPIVINQGTRNALCDNGISPAIRGNGEPKPVQIMVYRETSHVTLDDQTNLSFDKEDLDSYLLTARAVEEFELKCLTEDTDYYADMDNWKHFLGNVKSMKLRNVMNLSFLDILMSAAPVMTTVAILNDKHSKKDLGEVLVLVPKQVKNLTIDTSKWYNLGACQTAYELRKYFSRLRRESLETLTLIIDTFPRHSEFMHFVYTLTSCADNVAEVFFLHQCNMDDRNFLDNQGFQQTDWDRRFSMEYLMYVCKVLNINVRIGLPMHSPRKNSME